MITERIDTQALKQNVSCQSYLASKGYTLAGKGEEKWLPGGCPLCGTAHPGESDRFRVWQGNWWCRNCGAKGDVITLAQMLDRTDFVGATKMLGVAELPKVEIKTAPKKPWDYAEAAGKANLCHRDLTQGHHIGQDYLDKRGIEPQAWLKYHLGFTWDDNPQRLPAIVIPWYRKGQVVAIHYRYLDAPKKLDSEPGSQYKSNLYGGHVLAGPPMRTTALICEGELNAISINQVYGDYIDVVSVGSESMTPTPEQAEYLSKYLVRLAWMDKPERAESLADLIGGRWVSSERLGGDANDLLQKGTLGVTLAKVLLACAGEQQRLIKWELADMLSQPNADEGIAKYCEEKGLWK